MIVLGLIFLSLSFESLLKSASTLECFCPSCEETALQQNFSDLGHIKVDIQGAVNKPGVYEVLIGQRIAEVVDLAGGFSDKADKDQIVKTINLSKEIKDQDKIYIPFFEENQIREICQAEEQKEENENSSGEEGNGKLISINNASSTQLQSLSGIGEVKSKAIIDNRPYVSLEELVSKKVFSENLLNSLKEQISL